MKYLVVIEKAKRGFSAYAPDLPGCVAAGTTRAYVERAIREAIESHVDFLKAEGERVPRPTSTSAYVELST